MKYVDRGTPWGFARVLWVAIGATFAAGCSLGVSGDDVGGSGGAGGIGGSAGHFDEVVAIDDRENLVPGSNDLAAVQAPSSPATACTTNSQCPTGFCVDGFCCDQKCDNSCMACSAAKKGSGVDGVCGAIAFDTDPDNECPAGACDGKFGCKNYNGVACVSTAQCLSSYCVDGFCCNNICMGACAACSAAKKGSGVDGACGPIKNGTDPENECDPGACNGSGACASGAQPTFSNGAPCTASAQCQSGYCADGMCCDSYCLGNCQACTAAKKGNGINGVCGPIAYNRDPDEECWGGVCNGAGSCIQYNGVLCSSATQCLSGFCVDGLCCGNICDQTCNACSEAKKGQGADGLCGPIVSGRDLDNECNPGECNGSGGCNQPQIPQANGATCSKAVQCTSGNCVDGICCDTACTATCMACSAAKKGSGADGVCGKIGSELDPDNECNGGRCDGTGVCRYYNGGPCSSTGQCFSNYCVDGFCCNNVCVGACQACSSAKKGSGFNGVCGPIAANTDPDNECNPGECNGSGACSQAQAQLPIGAACTFAAQCASGFCADGICCDTHCASSCAACTAAKKGQGADGTCGLIIAGTDPDDECPNGYCDGSGICVPPTNQANGLACLASTECASMNCVDGVCCDTACSGLCVACSAAKKGQGANGTCGPIKADLDPENECNIGACNGSGACGFYNSVACSQGTECLSSYCVDGFCCNNYCGGTCYACSAAKTGNKSDGLCGFVQANTDPDNECSGVCDGAGMCTP